MNAISNQKKEMTRVKPHDDKGESRIVQSYNNCKRTRTTALFVGSVCMPLLCAGLSCCMTGMQMKEHIEILKKVIEMYGEDELRRLRKKVDKEQRLFLDACMNVNQQKSHAIIVGSLRLIDCIKKNNVLVDNMITDRGMWTFSFMTADRTNYIKDVYDEYKRMGGNESVVIYGIAEYMAVISDPTSIVATDMYREITGPTQLSRFVMQHKDAAMM